MALFRMNMSCDSVIARISLALDEELSPIEQAALDRHLDRCASCRAKELDLAGITRLVRAAPLVAYEPRRLPAARSRGWRSAAGSAGLALSAAAGLAAIILSGPFAGEAARSASPFRSTAEQLQFLRVEQSREPAELTEALLVPALYAARSL
jgi:anti-sigma factor RsiW